MIPLSEDKRGTKMSITLNESDIAGEASQWNFTKTIQTTLEDIEIDANFAWLLFSLLVAMVWFIYITHYSARVTGQILTRVLNHFALGSGYIRIGSLTWDALAGKIMFRDIVYITEDFTIRVQDGWLVFRWWRSYVPRDISEDLSHSDTRLSLLLNGLELHIYNRSHLYSELERLFGLDSFIMNATKHYSDDNNGENQKNPSPSSSPAKSPAVVPTEDSEQQSGWGARILGRAWRDLIPVIKVEICSGRVVFGNRLVPTTLCLSMEEGHMVYSTKPAVSKLDHFMHVVNCRAENFKVTLAPSLKYTGLNDEPPRLMGEGFVVLSSNIIDFYYYADEPGLVPEVPLMMELANGDVVECHPPIWGLDIRCGKGTDFSYGPWADRKREQLFKFFYPQSYQPQTITAPPRPGEKRAIQSFDIRFSTLAEATLDVLFSKCKETNAVHMTIGAGSYLEITIPWTVRADGCATRVSGQFLHVDASTSLQYRSLLEAETMEFSVVMEYPLDWNAAQKWHLSLTGTKATLHIIYEHRYFFQDLINDWSSRTPPDLLAHVPYTWLLNFCLKEFELVTVANQYNWIDCSSQRQENTYVAFSGDFLQLAFDLPFTDFLPPTYEIKFRIQGEALDMNLQLPEMSTSRPVLLALSTHARTANRFLQGQTQDETARTAECDKQHWRNFVRRSDGWIQCWTVPILSLTIRYLYHPMSAPGPASQANVPTPEREELLLTPVRFPTGNSSYLRIPNKTGGRSSSTAVDFDVTTLTPDVVNVELELGPSELFVYGTVLRAFLHLKENIFGEDQRMADMDPSSSVSTFFSDKNESLNRSTDPIPETTAMPEEAAVMDVRVGRPLHVDVSVTLHDIHAHLMKHCNSDDPPCPTVSLEKLSFEMHKTFLETQLQLVLSPAVLYSTDLLNRSAESAHLRQGFAILSALQVRGHAMFSPVGRALDEDTVEYAWLIEAVLGQLTGRLTLPQLQHVVAGLESFLQLALDDENQLSRPPQSQTACHHGVMGQTLCSFSEPPTSFPSGYNSLGTLCPSAEDIKYRMARFSVDTIDLTLVESGTAIGIQLYPIRLATCNLHSRQTHSGLSVLIPNVQIRQYLATASSSSRGVPILDDSASFTGRTRSEAAGKISSSTNSTWNRTSNTRDTSVEELYLHHPHHKPGRSSSPTTTSSAGIHEPIRNQQHLEWLEVGILELGPVYLDIGSSTDHSRIDLPVLQSAFLKLHDIRTKRLWFLWSDLLLLDGPKCCGCRGGCAFFGRNANGKHFFDSEPDSSNYAALANPLLRRGSDAVFAQSILRNEEELSFLIDFNIPTQDSASVGVPGGLSPPVIATSLSGRSSSSTVKNITTGQEDGTLTSSPDGSKIQSSRLSLDAAGPTWLSNDGSETLKRGTNAAVSTPVLPYDDPNRRVTRAPLQGSMPVLVDSVDGVPPVVPNGSRKQSIVSGRASSRASRSESQSELYFSAEEDEDIGARGNNTSSDELVSLSPSPLLEVQPERRTPPTLPEAQSKTNLSSTTSSSSSSSHSSSSKSSKRNSGKFSFNSAVSSADDEDDDDRDDFSLVDLHLQSARPVVDSPILLTSYITHLGGAECSDWSQQAPQFPFDIRHSVVTAWPASSSFKPRFVMVKSGFSSFRLVDRPSSTPAAGQPGAGYGFFCPNISTGDADKLGMGHQPPWASEAEEERAAGGSSSTGVASGPRSDATTVLVKVGRPIHLMVCPLTLESTQRFIESLVPTLEHLHPMTVVTRVRRRCTGVVESQNPLKKQRTALLEQKGGAKDGFGTALYGDPVLYQLRGSIQIPRINLCLLQAGIVEQIISLSALDNPRDLVCVSTAAVCIDALSLHFSQSIRQCRMVQTVTRPVEQQQPTSSGSKSVYASFGAGSKAKSRAGHSSGASENVFVEWTQTDSEQLMVSGTLGKIHLQLRRLNNDHAVGFHPSAQQPDNVTATVIPPGCSRVLFNFSCADEGSNEEDPSVLTDEERYGSVMFECGLQGLDLRAVKRVSSSQNQDTIKKLPSATAIVENETGHVTENEPDQSFLPVGSVPSHSSHASFKRSDKGTPTSELPDQSIPLRSSQHQPDKDVSSCSLQIQAVWLSFAAPPRTTAANKKSAELAGILDRNLLSTASPAINAWMNSSDRLTITLLQLFRASETRSLSVLAGLMAEALDVQQIHLPVVRSKYGCLSLISRTLQEDPSCQLSCVLHRYVLMLGRTDWPSLEARLSPAVVPPLSTLKQGVVVLSRQWKNAIYTPYMLTYSLQQTGAQQQSTKTNATAVPARGRTSVVRMMKSDVETGDDEEKTILLPSSPGRRDIETMWISSDDSSLILSPADLNESTLPLLGGRTTSPMPPKLSALRRKLQQAVAGNTPVTSNYELKTISASSADEETEGEEETDCATLPLKHTTTKANVVKEEDLYNWMARQQRGTVHKDPLLITVEPEVPKENEPIEQQQQQQHQPINLLVDTRAIFVPLFASVGLETKRSLAEILSLSGSASVLGGIEELRVEIFESEWSQGGTGSRRAKYKAGSNGARAKNPGSGQQQHKFTVYIPPEVPAFLCERMAIEIQVKQVSDKEKGANLEAPQTTVRGGAETSTATEGDDTGGGGGGSFLGQLGLLKPERTTSLNFSLSVGYLAQQVNMPLLRLVHQLGSVYLNAKNTQVQLREQRPLMKRGPDPLRTLAVLFDSAESAPPTPGIQQGPSFEHHHHGSSTLMGERTDPEATAAVTVLTPSCWRTIYHLLDLYASMTAASTVNKQYDRSISPSTADPELGIKKTPGKVLVSSKGTSTERTRLVVFGIMKISRVRLLAMLSGLRLESEIVSLHTSLTYKEKVRTTKSGGTAGFLHPTLQQHQQSIPRMECSLTGHLGRAMIVLLEGVAPSQQTVVKITVGKSQALYSRLSTTTVVTGHHHHHHHGHAGKDKETSKEVKDKNSGLLSVGAVHVDIPQHPGVLHGMMTRGSKQLSTTLQEFRVPRLQASRAGRNTSTIPDEVDNSGGAGSNSTNYPSGLTPASAAQPIQPLHSPPPKEAAPITSPEYSTYRSREPKESTAGARLGLQPLVMQFSIVLQRLSVTAALLPSLQAQYQMEQVVSNGVTGGKAKFDIDLPRHSLSFTTKLQITENLPPSASIELPQVHVAAEYLQESGGTGVPNNKMGGEEFVDGVVLCRGAYLSAAAEIGTFEHCLTTDLLNHLVFVQKVFMAEVNDVLNKVSGGDKPVPLWEDNFTNSQQHDDSALRMLLYNLVVRLKGIQITATTPTNTAVRLETGLVELQLSNRVQNVASGGATTAPSANPGFANKPSSLSSSSSSRPAKLFGRAKVDLNLSLGQLIRNPLFEEAEAEFQQAAFFKTRISLRNAFQDELTPGEGIGAMGEGDPTADKEVILITLTRPLIYLQPAAVDKAILVWLNYKNAYDYWTEQRGGGSWNNLAETLVSGPVDRLLLDHKIGQLAGQFGNSGTAPSALGTLFLQLTVDDMGICMPLNTAPGGGSGGGGVTTGTPWMTSGGAGRGATSSEPETCSAVVITLENSSISACSSGSLVSKGKFTGLCLRFADDFETGLDDWKPNIAEDPTIMNLCVVSEGTYEVCSRTVTPPAPAGGSPSENAKWILHVGWQMEGVDTHFDTSIGKQFSALGHTLTGLTGGEEEEEDDDDDEEEEEGTEDPINTGGNGTIGNEEDLDERFVSSEEEAEDDKLPTDESIGDMVELRRRRGRTERSVTISDMPVSGRGIGGRRRSRLIEKEMSEQARIIQDLRSLGASSATVEQEMRRLQELEAQASKDFRRVMLQRLKRQSVKTTSGGKPEISLKPDGSSSSLASSGSHPSSSRPFSLHHTQSQRLPNQNHGHHQRSKSVIIPPVVLDCWEGSEPQLIPAGGSSDSVPRLLLPPIDGSPPMSTMSTPTNETAQQLRNLHHHHRRPRTPSAPETKPAPASEIPVPGGSGPSGGMKTALASEPSVDLELDFKVFINSGKCVLHTRSPSDGHGESNRAGSGAGRMKKERSFSNTVLDSGREQQTSPIPSRKTGHRSGAGSDNLRQNASTSRLRVMANNAAQMAVDLTIFHIPGLDVKVYYESKTIHEDSQQQLSTPASASLLPTGSANTTSSPASSVSGKGKTSTKKGSLFAWMTLHSIPEETIISPHILEFLEQALEPIPITLPEKPSTETAGLFNFDGTDSASPSTVSTASSFPVDVVVYCHVQPSTFRFSCLPVSRVECLLRLPSLHLVFSSKRSDLLSSMPTYSTAGGLSVTGCLSDFSLYIFHPYGGGKKTGTKREADLGAESERKDSLSVNVEFVKFNLSRSRKINAGNKTEGGSGGGANTNNTQQRNGRDSAGVDGTKAVVRFSTLIDIGSASFKYDMRRLPEILAFPKAWYRRTIVRHLFLGDPSGTAPGGSKDMPSPSGRVDLWAELQPDQRGLSPSSAWETLVVFAVNFTRLNVHMNMGNVMGNVSWLTKDFTADGRLSIGSTGHKDMHIGVGLEGSNLDAKGGIVGGTIELSGIHTSLAIREDPGTEPDHRLAVNLQVLECRLDYMGTSVLMGRVSVLAVDLRDEWRVGNLIASHSAVKTAPPNRRASIAASASPTKRPAMIFIHGDLGWDQLQLMISKSTTADLIKMYLKLDEFFQQQFRSSRRIFSTFASPSTTGPGGTTSMSIRRKAAGMANKPGAPGATPTAPSASEPNMEAQHHRHWQKVLRRVAGLEVATLPSPLPMTGTILGGTMELHGGHISLACFHGVNFKSKSWALFSLKDPCVSFATEAQEIPGDDPKDIHVVQNLSFILGQTGISTASSQSPSSGIGYRLSDQQQQHSPTSMATVCRISRTQLFPPQFKTLQDWFLYAFANSRLDAMEKFPSLERERDRANSGNSSHFPPVKVPDYNHTAEVIFAFPSLQLHLKSEHWQSGNIPSFSEEKPSVDCSFITDFEDHIFVTMDAEAFFFLHDLITSYVREKERVILASAANNSQRTQSPELASKSVGTPADPAGTSANTSSTTTPSSTLGVSANDEEKNKRRILEQIDWRNYECKTWHLEPTVRLLSWAGKRIEPYGVEYILNKLGFSQARTTIPKWVQRGAMDPLDKILSLVLSRTIAAQRVKESSSTTSATSTLTPQQQGTSGLSRR